MSKLNLKFTARDVAAVEETRRLTRKDYRVIQTNYLDSILDGWPTR